MNKEKTSYFSLAIFLPTLMVVVLMNILTLYLFSIYFEIDHIPFLLTILLMLYWLFASALLAVFIRFNEIRLYENPMKRFAKATSEVAKGDFSVYVEPIHTMDKQDYLDLMINDFNKMVEALGSVETLKTDFLSNVSHEIKTPLSIIQNYAQLLVQPNLSEEFRYEYAQCIIDTSRKLSNLITNILKINKLEKQTIVLNVTRYDVVSQLTECILSMEPLWEEKAIEMDIDFEDACYILYDKELLDIVWNNLLSNAIKFSDEGKSIHIKQYTKDQRCFIQFIDEGCGMDSQTQSHIFEKFYQGDTSHAMQGNGLGLAMVARIIELVNGEIKVESKVNQGTMFTVILEIREEGSNEAINY